MNQNDKRLSYKVPLEMTCFIRQIAAQDGIEPSLWVRRTLERGINERLQDSFAASENKEFAQSA